MFWGVPFIKLSRFLIAMSISLCLVSKGAQAMCGVITQFGASFKGQSLLIGSLHSTSSAAAAMVPLSSGVMVVPSALRVASAAAAMVRVRPWKAPD